MLLRKVSKLSIESAASLTWKRNNVYSSTEWKTHLSSLYLSFFFSCLIMTSSLSSGIMVWLFPFISSYFSHLATPPYSFISFKVFILLSFPFTPSLLFSQLAHPAPHRHHLPSPADSFPLLLPPPPLPARLAFRKLQSGAPKVSRRPAPSFLSPSLPPLLPTPAPQVLQTWGLRDLGAMKSVCPVTSGKGVAARSFPRDLLGEGGSYRWAGGGECCLGGRAGEGGVGRASARAGARASPAPQRPLSHRLPPRQLPRPPGACSVSLHPPFADWRRSSLGASWPEVAPSLASCAIDNNKLRFSPPPPSPQALHLPSQREGEKEEELQPHRLTESLLQKGGRETEKQGRGTARPFTCLPPHSLSPLVLLTPGVSLSSFPNPPIPRVEPPLHFPSRPLCFSSLYSLPPLALPPSLLHARRHINVGFWCSSACWPRYFHVSNRFFFPQSLSCCCCSRGQISHWW